MKDERAAQIKEVTRQVICRRCRTAVGEVCRAPSGKPTNENFSHKERYQDAANAGLLDQFGKQFADQWRTQ